jgi:hypothetical protein
MNQIIYNIEDNQITWYVLNWANAKLRSSITSKHVNMMSFLFNFVSIGIIWTYFDKLETSF